MSDQGSNGPSWDGQRKAIEAMGRLYGAGLATGARSMVDSFELLSETAYRYQRRFTDTDSQSDRDERRENPDQWWKGALTRDIDEYRAKMEEILRKADVQYAEQAGKILDEVYAK